jgi:hypothetical protein
VDAGAAVVKDTWAAREARIAASRADVPVWPLLGEPDDEQLVVEYDLPPAVPEDLSGDARRAAISAAISTISATQLVPGCWKTFITGVAYTPTVVPGCEVVAGDDPRIQNVLRRLNVASTRDGVWAAVCPVVRPPGFQAVPSQSQSQPGLSQPALRRYNLIMIIHNGGSAETEMTGFFYALAMVNIDSGALARLCVVPGRHFEDAYNHLAISKGVLFQLIRGDDFGPVGHNAYRLGVFFALLVRSISPPSLNIKVGGELGPGALVALGGTMKAFNSARTRFARAVKPLPGVTPFTSAEIKEIKLQLKLTGRTLPTTISKTFAKQPARKGALREVEAARQERVAARQEHVAARQEHVSGAPPGSRGEQGAARNLREWALEGLKHFPALVKTTFGNGKLPA